MFAVSKCVTCCNLILLKYLGLMERLVMVEGGEELDVAGTAVVEAQVCRTGLVSGQGC